MANKGSYVMFGYPKKNELIGKNVNILIPVSGICQIQCQIQGSLRSSVRSRVRSRGQIQCQIQGQIQRSPLLVSPLPWHSSIPTLNT